MSETRVDRSQVEELFLEALELGSTERAAFLKDRCGHDPVLLAEVSSLLASADAPGLIPELAEERPFGGRYPERIGSYRIVRPLGEGGMGVVLLAVREGQGFEQTVALKLIRGSFVDPLLARRLEEERRILALLEHPGIARLVDGGVTADGQPYYAMEYVRGEDILEYCDARELILEDRLRLFAQVCDAVYHAHQQLIVHRDLKPSNILVTPEGRPKLLDFGIAKNLEAVAPAEQTAQWITPAYASPEQVTGNVVSTLSDVYSLGVLLCELLSGFRPYQTSNKAPAELIRIIGQDPSRRPSELLETGPRAPGGDAAGDGEAPAGPAPDEVARRRRSTPTRLARALRGELDLVVLKALAKEPHRRYESAWALGEDLRRYLEGRPLQARPDSAGYRMSKFVGRHRTLVGAAALLLVTLVGGVGGIVWQAGRTAQERDRAEVEATRAQQVTALMTDIFRLGDPTQSVGDTIGVRQVLEEGARRVDQNLGDDPVLQATLFLELARIYRNLGILREAERLGGRAVALREANEPGTLAYADVLGFQGLVLRDVGLTDPSVDHLERAIALRERLLPAPDTALATLLAGLGWEVRDAGDSERAAALFSRALEIQRALLGPDAPAVATSMFGLASAYHDKGSFDEAEEVFRSALAAGGAQASPVAATALVNLGMVQRLRERFQDAEPLLRAGLAMREDLFDLVHPDVIEARQELAVALSTLGRFDEAEPLLLQNLEAAVRLFGEDHQDTRSAHEALGTLLHDLGRYDEALVHLRRSMASKERAHGGDHPGVVYSLVSVGDVLLDADRPREAEASYREALAMGARLGGNEGVYGALARHGLARVALARNDAEAADSLSRESLTLAGASLREDHRYVLDIQRTRARLLLLRGAPEAAESLLAAVLASEERVRPHPHPRMGATLALLADARAAHGDRSG
ncbi:MAG TPA: tetratricopeptide repeat protein, partial [Longimicrobiales bacterium]|nr:tetratricopeptide repeat protein [Longimicrobiales bacterium]